MNRDPFYQDIIKRLGGRLDPEAFERCAGDLLRAVYPTLVPIRGGQDAGMDGAIADGRGLPYPLVCTTGRNVIDNLCKSLNSYKKRGGSRRRVVVATSRELTQRRRDNRSRAADKLGFHIVQIHAQASLADHLYSSPAWCLELLNLIGEPPALSVVPVTRRPLVGQSLVGRDGDLSWLCETRGDLLLVGQPGSGKTFLFQSFAKLGRGLFVIEDDRARIASGIRAQQPECLLVDDAQLRPRLLTQLLQLRTELGADFRILANCWPGEAEGAARALGITDRSIRTLSLLTRDHIAEIIRANGIEGPDSLIDELIDQAAGRPGLASTLCFVCINGNIREIAFANVLAQEIRATFTDVAGPRAAAILAAFAVGGHAGMRTNVVADYLGLSRSEIWESVNKLAAGGVVFEVDRGTLSVYPPALRHALVRDVFFVGTALDIDPLIENAPNGYEVVRTLIGARARGGSVPWPLLVELLERFPSEKACAEYAQLGAEECAYILDRYPTYLSSISGVALHFQADKAIALLLDKAIGDPRTLHANPDQPLRVLSDWIRAGYPGSSEAANRRESLLSSALRWLGRGGDQSVALRAMAISLSPQYAEIRPVPGSGNTVRLMSAHLTVADLSAIKALWRQVRGFLRTSRARDLTPIQEAIEEWVFPGRVQAPLVDEVRKLLRRSAISMLRDVVAIYQNPGIGHWAKRMSAILRAFTYL
jgi:hypothetical protein